MSQLKRVLVWALGPVWWFLGRIVPKDPGRVVVHSFPDFDDTVRAIAMAVVASSRRLVVLTSRRDSPPPTWLQNAAAEVAYRYSLKGIWLYHRSRYVFFTHGCYSAWPLSPNQTVVNLWHGTPIKRIGLLDGKSRRDLPRFHFTIAQDERFLGIMAEVFGVSRERVLVADHPRLDIMRGHCDLSRLEVSGDSPVLVWLPTYRASTVGDLRVDGDERANIFGGAPILPKVDTLLRKHGATCIVKPHPMAKVSADVARQFGGSLRLVTDGDLRARGLSLYQVLSSADALVTDLSSVYFDYKPLRRPVLLYCPDLGAYAASRGFVAPLGSLIEEPIFENDEDFLAALDATLQNLAARPREPRASDISATATLALLQLLETMASRTKRDELRDGNRE